ncbi:MAG: NADH-quinone oxidoreductase subunit N, partial [Proteobacteria bacterium]|nr:NADH-quinone oxidoreductase subunit N [Pseudomonadota bacterium]
MMIGTDLNTVLPELILAVFAMAALMFAVYFGKDRRANTVFWMTAIVMVVLAAKIAMAPAGAHTAF